MTDRQRQLIAAYLPHKRDPELGPFDYYVLDQAERCQKVHIRDIYPGRDDETYYTVYTDGGRRISSFRDGLGGFNFGCLYDNRQDCKDRTHDWINNWEALRKIEEAEA